MPTQERVRELYEYNQGNLYNRLSRNNSPVGAKIGFWNESYFKCNVDGRRLTLHKVIWIWHNGQVPKGMQIDHIDRDRRNNKIDNLRLATPSENLRNRTHNPRRVRTDPVGISFAAYERKWRAVVPLANGKRLYLAASYDKHRLIWLMHLYRKGLYKPGAKIKLDAPYKGGSHGIPRLRGNQSEHDLRRDYLSIATDLEACGITMERCLPQL